MKSKSEITEEILRDDTKTPEERHFEDDLTSLEAYQDVQNDIDRERAGLKELHSFI